LIITLCALAAQKSRESIESGAAAQRKERSLMRAAAWIMR
jgi:hypothetical protein